MSLEWSRENRANFEFNLGSNTGSRPEYLESAKSFGKLLAERQIEIIYGGAEVGLMGAVASAAIDNSVKVIGVIPVRTPGNGNCC
jgi:predicted Rossmann-fold nucleotide-binding protein